MYSDHMPLVESTIRRSVTEPSATEPEIEANGNDLQRYVNLSLPLPHQSIEIIMSLLHTVIVWYVCSPPSHTHPIPIPSSSIKTITFRIRKVAVCDLYIHPFTHSPHLFKTITFRIRKVAVCDIYIHPFTHSPHLFKTITFRIRKVAVCDLYIHTLPPFI